MVTLPVRKCKKGFSIPKKKKCVASIVTSITQCSQNAFSADDIYIQMYLA